MTKENLGVKSWSTGRAAWVLVLFAFVLSLSLAADKVSAHFGLSDLSANQLDKKDKKDKKEKKDKKKSDDDDDDDDDDDGKDKKKEEKSAKSDSKASVKTESKAKTNAAPNVALLAEKLEAVNATIETDPVPHGGDAADDPAIWVHPQDPSKSTIIGTDKQGGLAVYDLNGKQIQYLADGLMDNVDLRDGFKLGNETASIVAAGNRKDNSIAIYKVNPQTRQLENVAARAIKHGVTAYGMCLYRNAKAGKLYYFATSKSGDVEQWELFDSNGKVDAKQVRKFKVGSVVEGCVADDELGHFYVSEEAVGIWKYGAEPEAGDKRTQVDKVGGGNLVADVEGLAIAYGADGKGYLLVSSQGNYSYVVYRREGNNEFVKRFRVGDGSGIDGAEETDGIDVTTANLGPAFPQGVFVAQDGFNDKGNQNFKLVPLQAILKLGSE
ncbi:MAG: phytase [Acidobacteria bacterium]|nr:phytase [Acidobacteriota bacterium]